MLRNLDYWALLAVNLLVIGSWHLGTFMLAIHTPDSGFQPDSVLFRQWKWEQGGRWYRRHLHIERWKDRIPQFVDDSGFSKRHLTNVTQDYLERFISETCRGEWMHSGNLGCVFLLLLLDRSLLTMTFSTMIVLGNGPCALIQRYNRFRLLALRGRLQQEARQAVATT